MYMTEIIHYPSMNVNSILFLLELMQISNKSQQVYTERNTTMQN